MNGHDTSVLMSRYYSRPSTGQSILIRLGLGGGVAIALFFFLLLLKLLLPWLVLAAIGGVIWQRWQRHQAFQQRLYQCFYECLQRHEGRISALDFAMTAQITGPQARSFLDARAKDFFADFEPTNHGDILYTFRRAATPATEPWPQLPG
ncbi:MAG TPA: hypothetical protein V6D02_15460 [Candidatus Obscuribacterales bacterium]